jgi:hypothetical protein
MQKDEDLQRSIWVVLRRPATCGGSAAASLHLQQPSALVSDRDIDSRSFSADHGPTHLLADEH